MGRSVERCLFCEVNTAGDHEAECPMNIKNVEKTWVNYGWTCPVCGRGMAPWATSCPCVISDFGKIWCGTGSLNTNPEDNIYYSVSWNV